MKALNEYINEDFYKNVKASVDAILAEINQIDMVRGHSQFKYNDPDYKKMAELWHKLPVGIKLKWKMEAGTYRYEKTKQDDSRMHESGEYDYWNVTRAPWGDTRENLSGNVVKDFYCSGVISRGPLEIDK